MVQTQETMTAQVANAIQIALKPKGVAILVDAKHQCMTTRGVKKPNVSMVTTRFTGHFKDNAELRDRFYQHIKLGQFDWTFWLKHAYNLSYIQQIMLDERPLAHEDEAKKR